MSKKLVYKGVRTGRWSSTAPNRMNLSKEPAAKVAPSTKTVLIETDFSCFDEEPRVKRAILPE